MEVSNKKEKIKAAVAISIILITIIVAVMVAIIYQIEGEKDLPFVLTKITTISTAEGVEIQENAEQKWNLDIYQNNDIYFYFEKNKELEDEEEKNNEVIKSIVIDNIKVTKEPEVGHIF